MRIVGLLILLGICTFTTSATAQWSAATSGPTTKIGWLVAGPSGSMYAAGDDGLFVSSDHGTTWTLLSASFNRVWGISGNGELWAGDGQKEVRSSNGGVSWTQKFGVSNGGYDPDFVFAFKGKKVLAASGAFPLFYDQNYGVNPPLSNLATGSASTDYPQYAGFDFRGTAWVATQFEIDTANGAFDLNNNFKRLTNASFGSGVRMGFHPNGYIVAGGANGVFYSTDRATSWTRIDDVPSGANIALAFGSNGYIFEGFSTGGLKLRTSVDASWQDITAGLKSKNIYALEIARDGRVFAGTDSGVFVYSDLTGDVKPLHDGPKPFALEQNVPNPVSKMTTIHFSLAEAAPVTLKVYDFSGREISCLACANYTAGSYDVTFDVRGLAAGVYYYELHAGTSSAGRMLIVSP
jgi:hypothetical protein